MNREIAKRHFLVLDGLRGIAAILVVAFHFRSSFLGFDNWPAGDGYLAVDLFFALSGFVLGYAYLSRMQGGMTLLQFMTVRYIRLYPLYFAGLMVGTLTTGVGYLLGRHNDLPLANFVSSFVLELFMLPSLPPAPDDSLFLINPIAWSLFFEILLSLLFGIFWRAANVKVLSAIVLATGIIVCAVSFNLHHSAGGNNWHTAWFGGIKAIFSFTVGLLIHSLHRSGRINVECSPTLLLLAIALMIIYLIIPVGEQVRGYFDVIFIVLISPGLIVLGTSRLLDGKWVRALSFLGSTSYALYALHFPVLTPFRMLLEKALGSGRVSELNGMLVLLYVACLLGISYFADLLYDTPIRRRLTRRLIKRDDLRNKALESEKW